MDLKIDINNLTSDEKSSVCFALIQEGKAALKNTTLGYIRLGEVLEMLLGKGGLWKHYSSSVQTKDDFVKDAFCIGLSMADHVRRITRTFKEHIGERTIPFYKLLDARPYVTSENIEEVLDKAETLSPSDWKNEIHILKGKSDRDLCEHIYEVWNRCKICGYWMKSKSVERG